MKKQNITFNFDLDTKQLAENLEFLVNEFGCSSEQVGKTLAELSQKISQMGTNIDQFIGADTTEKNKPLEIFDPIELNEDELWIIPIGDNEEWKIN